MASLIGIDTRNLNELINLTLHMFALLKTGVAAMWQTGFRT